MADWCASRPTTPAWPRADAADKPDPTPPPQDVTYTIVVDFGEWNVKNGYTAPAVKPNRWPLRRSAAAIFLRKRSEDEVAPRSVENALVATACHELGCGPSQLVPLLPARSR